MNIDEFRRYGRQMVDYIADYYENIGDRDVLHKVSPDYMRELVPSEAPQKPEKFAEIFKDIERVIMPGITHWRHPNFHGYLAAGGSFPSQLGGMLCDAIGCIGVSWVASPACMELEVITTDWLGKMINLPEEFLHCGPGRGGGVIQTTASETTLLCLLAARSKTVSRFKDQNAGADDLCIVSKLVAYFSDQANGSVERAGLLGGLRMVKLPSDEDFRMRGETLAAAIRKDKAAGLIPFFVCATLGTTGSCSFDAMDEIGPICEKENMWLHVDAAYAGSVFVCPEFRSNMKGIEYAQSFSVNPHKWMLTNFDLSVMWIKNSLDIVDAFSVDPVYLHFANENRVPNFRVFAVHQRHYVFVKFGLKGLHDGLQNNSYGTIRHCRLAKEFEQMVLEDGRFEIVAKVVLGLVCFRMKGKNVYSEKLQDEILKDRRIFMTPDKGHGKYYLRLAVSAESTTSEDIRCAFDVIRTCADRVSKTTPDVMETKDVLPSNGNH